MCLESIKRNIYKNKRHPFVAYKVVRKIHKKSVVTDCQWSTLNMGINEDDYDDTLGPLGAPYRTGFHVFKKLKEARLWCESGQKIIKVFVYPKSVTAVGKQSARFGGLWYGLDVVVARKIRIDSFKTYE